MLLQKLHENYDALMQIGIEAREAGRKIGLEPSCAGSTVHDEDSFKAKEPKVAVRKVMTR
ncbi:hypothetical protein ELI00_37525 [Rhizobium ruizarguesonis]|uniref:hypothetical protein n=1 Tax=Rhizobium ruizarguesonis TaxID=2081791 RepID=UPI00103218B5|nr:hypothetical protein [Rhizobium ruizarguesonis]TAX63345.1 hypothetical protein ELI00_37525 [Rhizobium ruizarguesonis]